MESGSHEHRATTSSLKKTGIIYKPPSGLTGFSMRLDDLKMRDSSRQVHYRLISCCDIGIHPPKQIRGTWLECHAAHESKSRLGLIRNLASPGTEQK